MGRAELTASVRVFTFISSFLYLFTLIFLYIHLAHVSNARTKSADLLGGDTGFLSVFGCSM